MKRWQKYALAAFIVLAILGIAYEAKGQGCPDDYGCGYFYRSDIYSRDGIRAEFRLDPGVQGSALIQEVDEGDYETWTGAEGGCSDCATNWTCACAGTSDVQSETTHIYKTSTSMEMADGDNEALAYYTFSLVANVAYQVSWCHLGDTGGQEDFTFTIRDAGSTDYYNFATDAWQGGAAQVTYTNIAGTWVCVNHYVTTGVAAKTDYQLRLLTTSANDTIYVDNFQVQRLNFVNVTGSRGNVLSVPVTSDPQWGHSEVLLPRVGTGPAFKTGMELDGVNDYLSCADADCAMDPILWEGGGFFSVGCRLVTDTVAAGVDCIIGKWGAAGVKSWRICRSANGLNFYITDDGTNVDFNTVVMFNIDTLHNFVSTFDPSGGSGACENNIYYNAYQVDVDATMTECAPFNSTVNFEIGEAFGTFWSGSMLECVLWQRELSAVEANKFISPHFPATNHGDGFWVDTCSQAASHTTCSTQVCRDGTPNSCQSEGSGSMAIFGQFTELVIDNSLETYAGDPSVANWTDWTETEVAGDGTSAITAYLADTIHKDASARLAITGTTSSAQIDQCIACSDSTAYYAYGKFKEISGASTMDFYVEEHDDGTCTSLVATNAIATNVDIPEVWTEYGDGFTTTGTTASCKFIVLSDTTASDFLVDFVSFKAASYRTPPVENPSGGVSTTYNSRQYELHNPLSDYCQSEGADCYLSGFCAAVWFWTPWVDDGVNHYILVAPPTAGNNNRWHIQKAVDDGVYFRVYDGAGNERYVFLLATGTNWTANGWKYIEVCSNNSDNVVSGRWYNVSNSTWYAMGGLVGAGTGIQSGQATDLHIGHYVNTSYLDGYQSEIHISPYSAIFPQEGFNGGRPPINGAPY